LIARATGAFEPGTTWLLYRGLPATTPVTLEASGVWQGEPALELGDIPAGRYRYELVWTDAGGRSGTAGLVADGGACCAGAPALAPPAPNPVRGGQGQTWSIRLEPGDRPGTFQLSLLDVSGRRVLVREVRIDVPGMRLVPWDGRDRAGRPVPAGVYFLEALRPDGGRERRKIVVLR
jgi:hypothetical protein